VDRLSKYYFIYLKSLIKKEMNKNSNIINKDNSIENKLLKFNPMVEKLLSVINISKIYKLINNMDSINKLTLGDTILTIILKNDKVFGEVHKFINNKTQIYIYIKESYIHKLAISSINITQLPMLVKPRDPDSEDNYAPYLKSEISHIYNSFDTIIKNKFTNKFNTQNQRFLNKTISYLNNIEFSINYRI